MASSRLRSMQSSAFARWVALPFGVVAISTSGILIRLTTAPPLVTASNRLLLASSVLLIVALAREQRDLRSISRRTLGWLAVAGVVLGCHFALWTTSLFYTSVASAVLLADTHPVLIALGAAHFLGEATPLGVWVGILLTLLGGGIIAGADLGADPRAILGDLMAIGASITFAIYLLIGRRTRRQLGTATYAGLV